MTTSVARELLNETLAKGYAIADELKLAREEAQKIRDSYNVLKARQTSSILEDEAKAELAQVVQGHDTARDKALAPVQAKLDRATAEYNKNVASINQVHNSSVSKASDAMAKSLAGEQEKLKRMVMEAQAEAHIADQKANTLAASLERLDQQSKAQLGVDLGPVWRVA